MIKFIRAFGEFGLFGAICAIAWFPVVWTFIFIAFTILPYVADVSPDPARYDEIRRLILVLYGLSWFGGTGHAWHVLFPNKLDQRLYEACRQTNAPDKTGDEQAQRIIVALTGPWWLFVGLTTFAAYFSESHLRLWAYELDGATTLFAFSATTIAAPFITRLFLETLHWVRTVTER